MNISVKECAIAIAIAIAFYCFISFGLGACFGVI